MVEETTYTVTLVFGTRPEVIKLAPVVRALSVHPRLHPRLCLTGQHREMVAPLLDFFGLAPDEDLDLMQPDQTLAAFTARALTAVDDHLRRSPPDCILVQGDTSSVLAAALAAFYLKIPVGHVEAGLRTGNRFAPFPEEINRVATSRLADYHFAPTEGSRDHLLAEGLPENRVAVTGNTVVDALLHARDRVREMTPEALGLPGRLAKLGEDRPYVLVTGHRRENFGAGFEAICRALSRLADRFPEVSFVYPVHLNPSVREPVFRLLGDRTNLILADPVPYPAFVRLMDRCRILLTDSGGIQEEGPSLGKPVLVMRETTERPEGVAAGAARLLGADEERIVEGTAGLLEDEDAYRAACPTTNPYGDGRAAGRIAEALVKWLDEDRAPGGPA